jgi:hypothetical protein
VILVEVKLDSKHMEALNFCELSRLRLLRAMRKDFKVIYGLELNMKGPVVPSRGMNPSKDLSRP